jgi:hypothetical protein
MARRRPQRKRPRRNTWKQECEAHVAPHRFHQKGRPSEVSDQGTRQICTRTLGVKLKAKMGCKSTARASFMNGLPLGGPVLPQRGLPVDPLCPSRVAREDP